MRLHREERDNYVVSYTTDPPLTGIVQASFDGGTTWIDGTPTSDNWAWLVAGPDFDAAEVAQNPADTVAVITKLTTPLLRLKDDPVVDIEEGPVIDLWP